MKFLELHVYNSGNRKILINLEHVSCIGEPCDWEVGKEVGNNNYMPAYVGFVGEREDDYVRTEETYSQILKMIRESDGV